MSTHPALKRDVRNVVFLLLASTALACAVPTSDEAASSTSNVTQGRCQTWDRSSWLPVHDDSECVRFEPSNKERSLSCPVLATDGTGFSPSSGPIAFDANRLAGIVDPDIKMTVILIKRINGVPHYHYMSNGTGNDQVYPWSTTKFMGVAFAAQTLRTASGGAVGLTAHTSSNMGSIPLGDLATAVHTYEYDHAGYPSNGLSRWFFNIAGRDNANAMIHGWLGRPNESIGANYGYNPPDDLGYTFTAPGGASVSTGADQSGYTTSLSTFTIAEMLKRLAVWDDVGTRLPGLTPEDVQTLLYGAPDSKLYAGELGGMSGDLSRVVQNALDMRAVDERSRGRWRNFGKLGQGTAERGNPLVDVQYACLPVFDGAGNPVPNKGVEFAASSFIAGGSPHENDTRIAENYRRVIQQVILPAYGGGAGPVSGGALAASCEAVAGTTRPGRNVALRFGADASGAGAIPVTVTADGAGAFRALVPRALYTGGPIHVWGNADSAVGPALDGSGSAVQCLPSLEGTLRPMTFEAYQAWRFDPTTDIAPIDEAALAGRTKGPVFAGTPVLVRAPGDATVWAVESNNFDHKHAIPSMQALADWHFGGLTIHEQPAESIASYPLRNNLRARPELVRTPDGSVYMVE